MKDNKVKLATILLAYNDIEAAIEFYKKLGLDCTFRVKDKWAEIACDSVKIGCVYTDHDLQERFSGVVFEVEDARKLYEHLITEGVECSPPEESIHGIMMRVTDPGKNIFDVYQPTPEKVKQALHEKRQQEGGCCPEGTCASCK